MEKDWWKKSVVYQIYPQSFMDSNGDGIGDLNGIIQKLDYLQNLGVDVLWICPMYASPLVDNGYDISDYYKVNPIFGTNTDMEHLIDEARKRNIKIILDLVVNHCSDQHEWFQKAKADPMCEEADYFYFCSTEDDQEPNNWRSNFGGSVWSRLPDGRWYYHTFAKEQPDLNWECKKLRDKIYEMINWWLEKGIAGFRVDAITFIKKDLSFASKEVPSGERYPVEKLTDYPGIGVFLNEMKKQCFEKYNCMTVAEAPGVDNQAFERYAGKEGYFSMIFDFGWENMEEENDKSSIEAVERWKKKIFQNVSNNSKIGWSAIFLENHDQSRCLNKFLKKEAINFYSASALASIYFFLYGTPFIYQGQEIGMTNVEWKNIEDMDDVRAKRTYQEAVDQGKNPQEVLAYFSELGRDNARTPMQWSDEKNGGFSIGIPWIKCNDNYQVINVEHQIHNPGSLYNYYKRLIKCYHDHADIVKNGAFHTLYENEPGLIAYEREWNGTVLTVAVNFTNQKLAMPYIDQPCILHNYKAVNTSQMQPYEARIYYGRSAEA
jgi:glycosidase